MNDESLRAKIRNMSKELNIPPHLLLQNYLLERLLHRISMSDYKENIVLKGGLLIASLIGVDRRTTMDMDTAIKAYPVEEEQIQKMLIDLLAIDLNDGVSFEFVDIKEIRQADEYKGYRAKLVSRFGKITQNLSIDISTGDVITPEQIVYSYDMLVDEGTIEISSYNIESVLAEKFETIISRGTLNTRMRDFYDVYILEKMKSDVIDWNLFVDAVEQTFQNRDSFDLLELLDDIIEQIEGSKIMEELWVRYLTKNPHIDIIGFNEICDTVKDFASRLK